MLQEQHLTNPLNERSSKGITLLTCSTFTHGGQQSTVLTFSTSISMQTLM